MNNTYSEAGARLQVVPAFFILDKKIADVIADTSTVTHLKYSELRTSLMYLNNNIF